MLIYYEHIYSVKCTYMLRIYNKDVSTEENFSTSHLLITSRHIYIVVYTYMYVYIFIRLIMLHIFEF